MNPVSEMPIDGHLIRSLEWKRLQEAVAFYFELMGFSADEAPLGPDGGIDVRLRRPNGTVDYCAGIQCKAWAEGESVGVKEIREFFGALQSERIGEGFFVATSEYTAPAVSFAQRNSIKLLDAEGFAAMAAKLPDKDRRRWFEKTTAGDYWVPTCPACGLKMVERASKRGRFWGCSGYPRCERTMPIRSERRARFRTQPIASESKTIFAKGLGIALVACFALCILSLLLPPFRPAKNSRAELPAAPSAKKVPPPAFVSAVRQSATLAQREPLQAPPLLPPPELRRYEKPSRLFNLAVESNEPANPRQLEYARLAAEKAREEFDRQALPPYFAVRTLSVNRSPRLAAYLVYETRTGTFANDTVFILKAQSKGTVAILWRYECYFVEDVLPAR